MANSCSRVLLRTDSSLCVSVERSGSWNEDGGTVRRWSCDCRSAASEQEWRPVVTSALVSVGDVAGELSLNVPGNDVTTSMRQSGSLALPADPMTTTQSSITDLSSSGNMGNTLSLILVKKNEDRQSLEKNQCDSFC